LLAYARDLNWGCDFGSDFSKCLTGRLTDRGGVHLLADAVSEDFSLIFSSFKVIKASF